MQLPSRRRPMVLVGIVIGGILVSVTAGVVTWSVLDIISSDASTPPPKRDHSTSQQTGDEPKLPQPKVVEFDKQAHSHNAADSIWVVVNKQRPLSPLDYTPSDLMTGLQGYIYSRRIDSDLRAMFAAAAREGVSLQLSSAYRSYANQQVLYANYVAQYGQQQADTISARPGYSEHQTGLTVDIGGVTNPACNFNVCFGETLEGKWLAEHVAEFGFVVRYTAANSEVSGYSPEPWHIRYVGTELASELRRTGSATLEEFFGVAGGWTYRGV